MSRINYTKITTFEKAAALIPDNSTISVSSSSGLGCPDRMLKAIGDRFRECGSPGEITSIHPIAAGDMYGIDGIDHIAEVGLLKRVIAGSLPSGPSSMPSPKIWQMIFENQVEAYNFPSGIIFHMHREAAAKRPGLLTQVGLQTYLDPNLQGGKMNQHTCEDLVSRVNFDGQEWLYFRSIPIDVAIVRGTTADEKGNISMEHEGAFLGAFDQALAAHNNGGLVIAQVKRTVAAGSLSPQQVRIPGILVDCVVVDPEQMQTTQTGYDPAISGEIRQRADAFEIAEWGSDKTIARRAAMSLQEGEAVNLGFGISALVPRVLLEESLAGAVTWVIEQGAVGGMPLLNFQFGCAANSDAIVPSPDQFTYFQGGGFDRSMLSFLEVDAQGNVNVSRLAARPHITAGVGGFVDITANAKNIVFSGYFTAGGLKIALENGRVNILSEGKVKKFVPQVEHITFSGQRARTLGQHITYVTERCVLSLEPDGLTVVEIAPGIDLQRDVFKQTDIRLKVSNDLKEMDPKIFSPEKMGLTLGVKPARETNNG